LAEAIRHQVDAKGRVRAGPKAFGAVLPIVKPLLQRPGAAGQIALGLRPALPRQTPFDGKALRYAVAAVLFGFGLSGIWRVVYDPGALARRPFCLVS